MLIEFKPANIERLWAEIGSGSRFSLEDLLIQMSASLDLKEDYKIIHRDRGYVISSEDIATYFETHERPRTPMSLEQQLTAALKRIEDLEKQIGSAGKASERAKLPISVPVIEVESTPYEETPVNFKPDPNIGGEADRMTPEQIQRELARDLDQKKGQSFRKISPANKPRSPVVDTV
jgi:hypothetical protein